MRVNIESSALAEGRFNKLAEHYFEGSRAEAIGALVLFWFDSQEREFISGDRKQITNFLPFTDSENEAFFDALLKYGYLKKVDEDLFEISGNERHVEKKKSISEARRNSAIKGNQVRWGDRKPIANDRKVSQQDAVNAVQYNAKQFNSKKTKSDFDFDAIYELYPRKEGKTKGIDNCRVQIKTKEDFDLLLRAVTKYSKLCREERKEKKFIKMFSSFMAVWRDYATDDPPAPIHINRAPSGPPPNSPEPERKITLEEMAELRKKLRWNIKPIDDGPGAA